MLRLDPRPRRARRRRTHPAVVGVPGPWIPYSFARWDEHPDATERDDTAHGRTEQGPAHDRLGSRKPGPAPVPRGGPEPYAPVGGPEAAHTRDDRSL